MSDPVVKVPFRGDCITAYTEDIAILDVTCWAEYLRGPDHTCAYCHGDPCAERPCERCGGAYMRFVRLTGASVPGYWEVIPHADDCQAVTWIDKNFAAGIAAGHMPENCPCCNGRPT